MTRLIPELSESPESQAEHQREQERFHMALRDAPAQPEAKPGASGNASAPENAAAQTTAGAERRAFAASNKFQGELGEQQAATSAVQRLDLIGDTRFTPGYHGFDGVYTDRQGRTVVLEAKFTEQDINHALKPTKYGPQMSEGWVERKVDLMRNENSRLYTPGNAEIGVNILDAEPGEVRRVTVLINPETLEAQAYEADAAGNWQQFDRWSVVDMESATLE